MSFANPQTRAEPIVSIENLKIEYALTSGSFTAVDDVTLDVNPGEILGLVGESGAGKSTVGNAVARLIDFPGAVTGGRILLRNSGDLAALSQAQMCSVRGKHIGMIFQDSLSALFPVKTVGWQLMRAIQLSKGLKGSAARTRALQLLEEVGISQPEDRMRQYPHQFSGGMRQRIVIAIALAGDPQLLIADEPTTALDVSIQSEILGLLKRLAIEHGAGVILITHDMAVIEEITDRVAVMRHGRLIEHGATRDVLARPEQTYTKALISAVPRIDKRMDRFVMLDDTALVPTALPVQPAERITADGPVIDAQNVTITFMIKNAILAHNRSYMKAADDVSLTVNAGSSIGIVGESGSGKSTLARAICGLQPIDSGTIKLMGHEVTELASNPALKRTRVKAQMIFQDPFASLDPRQRISAALIEPLLVNRMASRDEAREIARDTLIRVGMKEEDAGKLPHQFSGGQRQRICIARALVMQPAVLICDEPTSALDVSVQATIMNLLKDLRDERNLTLMFISHDLAVIRQVSDRVFVMQNGRVCEEADTDALFDDPQHDYTRHLLKMMPKFTSGARLQAR
ncbi:dipeptide ABC transporter ATP-binding protein [Roseovarius pelagicus]|uniref:ABC transporter ATP-binding protein n=1 Tax=Roseovarius pelagicus TaxID=2980108 RepID=A0ABY6DC85_9RHOB|nr:ABC transporter ATP-binding protein [Roseovarius pelagicus]UXX83175.1 ABC transporter ATP-binding protein [Roseovarius pelagicus]